MSTDIHSAADLSPQQKRAVLAQLLREKASKPRSLYPLSHGQRALWFLHQLAPESTAYNLGEALLVKGELDISILRRAFQKLIERHPSLRTTFAAPNGVPVQRVHEHVDVYFQEKDVSTWDEKQLSEYLSWEIERPFSLERGPLLRVGLYTRSVQERILLLTMHHIVGELWALIILLQELTVLYRAEKAGIPADLPPLRQQYTDFVRWQLEMLTSPEGEKHWTFWQKKLAGELPTLNLPTDRPRPKLQTYCGALHPFKVSRELTRRLKVLARAEGATLYMTLLSAFMVQLHHYTSHKDVIVGSPITGRIHPDWAGIVGFFDNPLPLRANLSGNPKFVEVLKQVRKTVLEAFEHQAYPFPLIVERLQPTRDPSRSALFNVMFVLRQSYLASTQDVTAFSMGRTGVSMDLGDGLVMESFDLKRRVAQFDLSLSVAEVDEELQASWQYNTDLFDIATIERMSGHFQTLLEGILAAPEQPVLSLPLLTAPEREQILVEWNDTQTGPRQDQLIHHTFEVQALRIPDDIAIVSKERRFTYQALNRKANQVGHWLRQRGARPNTLVAVVMEKGWEQVVAVLGIVKSGAAYLPLEPKLPKERLWYLLEQGEVDLVLTQSWLSEHLEWPENVQRFCVNDKTLEDCDDQPLAAVQRPDDLAYVIFTSGSTGLPKGVMIDHCGVVNTISDINQRFAMGAQDRVLALSSLSFDLSVYDIFGTLAVGGTLVIPEAAKAQDPAHWLELVVQERVTIWNSVPTLLQLLVDYVSGQPELAPRSIRAALLSGDWIPVTLPDRFKALVPGAQVISLGGATEASIWSVLYLIKSVDPFWKSIPYGRPMANQRFYIFNEGLEPCPVGVVGQLYIGGVGLAKGYWRDEQKTSASFITHPQTSERLYRTGDLGRYLPDGNIEFLGRIDSQVKIRGFRIELGEIEAILRQHPAVKQTVVLAHEDTPGKKRLVAYVVLEQAVLTSNELRSFLEGKLPDYLMPSVIVFLDTFPLSSNGKVDRKGLPMPPNERPELRVAFIPPRTAHEEILARIWAQVLGLDRVGTHDNFLELGGDSIQGIQVSVQAYQQGLRFSPRQLFENPTITELAKVAETRKAVHAEQSAVAGSPPLTPRQQVKHYTPSDFPLANLDQQKLDQVQAKYQQVEDIYPLAPMQQTMLLHSLYASVPEIYCEHVICDLQGNLNIFAFRRAWQQMVDQYPSLRAAFVWEGFPEPLQVIQSQVDLPLAQQDWRGMSKLEQQQRLQAFLREDQVCGFDFSQAPLMRFTLIRVAENDYQLIWSHHHILFDGWSLYFILKEFLTCYEILVAGQNLPINASPLFVDYIQWLKQQNQTAAETFWRNELQGFLSATPFQVDQYSESTKSAEFKHAEQQIQLSKIETERMTSFARQHRLTLNTVLQGSWALLLSHYSDLEDITFGITVSGRPETLEGIESMVGLFINTLPLRVQISPEDTILSLLEQIQQKQVKLREFGYVPLQQIQRWSDLEQNSLQFGLFSSILVFENFPVDALLQNTRGSLHLSNVDFTEQTNTPLMVYAMPGTALSIRITYDQNRFPPMTITRMLGHLQILLRRIATTPETRSRNLSILTEAEQNQLLVEWNDTKTGPLPNQCIHNRFEEQVERTPEAVAVVFEEVQLSYRELNQKANQLAHYLQKLGVGPESLIGICVDRSLDMVVGLLGILKAGGAYIPLDPTYPKERLAFMLKDAQVPILLSQQRLVEDLPQHEARVVCLDRDREAISEEIIENPISEVTADNLAYIIYTSGSTGKPKGVMIQHSSLVSFTDAARIKYVLGPCDRVLQFASISFDTSAEEIYPCLTSGATLILRTNSMLDSVPVFMQHCQDWALTVLNLPTAYWHDFTARIAAEALEFPSSVRLVIIGGERALPQQLSTWQSHVNKQVRLVNTYGPTEATVVATTCELSQSTEVGTALQVVPIGRAIRNVKTYVLNRHLQPVPIGVPGELHIAGSGLARGYLNHPELTVEKFIPNPFSDKPGARMYKTGDLVRYLPDGEIEFLDRIDRQVKIRGFRIELGEIEAVLSQHLDIRETVVMVREDEPGEKRLVAYIVPTREQALTTSELRSFLKAKLPEHMVPSAFIILNALPMTPNCKVDHRVLPPVDRTRPKLKQAFVAPHTSVEEVLVGIWTEVLGLEQVGIHDNFFELGGHSLQTIQLASKMSTALSLEIPVRFVLMYPTIAKLSVALTNLAPTSEGSSRIHSKEVGSKASTGQPKGSPEQQPSPFIKIEHRPLLSLFAAGKVAPVEAAAFGYLPTAFLEYTGLNREEVIHDWCHDLPVVHDILETSLGRIASIMLPRFGSELYVNQEDLVGVIVEALEIAGRLEARTVSLTGLIPSATNYGRAIVTQIAGRNLPMISTGHATTAAAIILSIKRILQEGRRDITQERVGFLGLGSIGNTSLRLMLKTLPQPAEITLCDVYNKHDLLEKTQKELVSNLGFRGVVRVMESQGEVPSDFYDTTLIIGATNVPDILDITHVKPGTMIVDDSGPHCFNPEIAIQRFQKQKDILFTEGGVLRSPQPISRLRYWPHSLGQLMSTEQEETFFQHNPFEIMGCVFSSLLSSRFEHLKPTVGFVDDHSCFQHHEVLEQLGFQGATLHCGGYVLAEEFIQSFRHRFGLHLS